MVAPSMGTLLSVETPLLGTPVPVGTALLTGVMLLNVIVLDWAMPIEIQSYMQGHKETR